MTNSIHTLSLLITGLIGSSLVGCSAGANAADESVSDASQGLGVEVCPANVPATLAPAAGQTLKSSFTGIGVQIYVCTTTATSFVWTLLGPQANLFNDDGKLIGTHFVGPTWQGNDGSSVVGQRLAGVVVDPSAVPWLLLNGISHSSEDGRFSDVTAIQRLSTVGGVAPIDGCDAAHGGAVAQVPYSAQYVFYKAKPHGKVKRCGG